MCNCYAHQCEICEEKIPFHIIDFDYDPSEFRIWCEKHIPSAEKGSVIFTLVERWIDPEELEQEPEVGWQCAILGPAVGYGKDKGNHPNLGSTLNEMMVMENTLRIHEVTEEFLKSRWSGTREIISILNILHEEGIGDAFSHHNGKKIARDLRPVFRKMVAQAICAEFRETEKE